MATHKFLLDQHGSAIRRVMVQNPAETNSREGGYVHFAAEQDADDILAEAKHAREQCRSQGAFERVGTVPGIVYDQAVREGWAHDMDRWMRYLNENPAFRTVEIGL